MTKLKPYYAILNRNGTKDELTIHAPMAGPSPASGFGTRTMRPPSRRPTKPKLTPR